MLDLTLYIEDTEKGPVLTKEFYELGFHKKVDVFEGFMARGLDEFTYRDISPTIASSLYNRIVLGMLQHSNIVIKRDYPVKGERKQSPLSRTADIEYMVDRLLTTLQTVVIPNA